MDYHVPVLLKETLEYLNIGSGKKYIDCTLGGGGHTKAILQAGGIVLAIDQDQEALSNAEQNLKLEIRNLKLTLRKGNFSQITEIAKEAGLEWADGILFDLGVSSHQLDTDYRGFSFNKDAKLDMRMDTSSGVTAADLINAGSEEELARLFWRFGEERFSKRIAKAIVTARETKGTGIETTNELAEIITSVRPKTKGDRMHPATRVFQALRVAVNSELDNLKIALDEAEKILGARGRMVIISFHSLEDRIVKDYMRTNTNLLRTLTIKPVIATQEEIENNPRSRSGKLRAAEKI